MQYYFRIRSEVAFSGYRLLVTLLVALFFSFSYGMIFLMIGTPSAEAQSGAPTCTLNVSPTSLSAPGNVTLTWSTTNADEIEFTPAIGSAAVSGTRTVNVSETTTFRLIAGIAGTQVSPGYPSAVCERTVTVGGTDSFLTPTNLTVTPACVSGNPRVTVSWNAVSGADLYQVFRCTGTSCTQSTTAGASTRIADASGTSYVDTSVSAGTTYRYAVRARVNGNWGDSSRLSANVNATTPTSCSTTTSGAPTCTLNVSQTSLSAPGNVTLTWSTTNADEIEFTPEIGLSNPGPSGSHTMSVSETTTFRLFAGPSGPQTSPSTGPAICERTVTVAGTTTPPPAPTTLTATPACASGGSRITLNWNAVAGAETYQVYRCVGTSCTPSALQSSVQGTSYVDNNVTAGNTYRYRVAIVIASGRQGTFSAIAGATASSCASAGYTCELNVSPTSLSAPGNVKLTWSTTNADSVEIHPYDPIGPVSASGSITVAIDATTKFQLFAGPSGPQTSPSTGPAICERTVTVAGTTTSPPSPPPTASTPTLTCSDVLFTASDNDIRRGDSVILNWAYTGNVESASINQGIGTVASNRTRSVSPTANTTYTITIKNSVSEVSCPLTVRVRSSSSGGGGGGGGGGLVPRCEFTASSRQTTAGNEISLIWNTSNAQDITIVDGNNNTIVTTRDRLSSQKDELLNGSTKVRPTASTRYTLAADRGTDRVTCVVDVVVSGSTVSVQDYRDTQELAVGIALSEVPYTGFNDWPVVMRVFTILVGFWLAYLGYVLYARRRFTTELARKNF